MIHEVHDEDFSQAVGRYEPDAESNDWPGEDSESMSWLVDSLWKQDILAVFKEKDTHDTIRRDEIYIALAPYLSPLEVAIGNLDSGMSCCTSPTSRTR